LTTATALYARLLAGARLRQWQLLVLICEQGTVHAAADSAAISQPAATHALRELERLLGAALFTRHARGMQSTPLGRALLPHARRMLAANAACAEAAAAQGLGAQEVLRVCALVGAVQRLLAPVMAAFAQDHPGVLLVVDEIGQAQAAQAAATGQADLLLCREPTPLPEGWIFEPLADDTLVVLASARHPLRSARRIGGARLLQQRWLLPPAGSSARRVLDDQWARAAKPPRVLRLSTRSMPQIASVLQQSDALALVPHSVAGPWLSSGALVTLHCPWPSDLPPLGVLKPVGGLAIAAQPLVEAMRPAAVPPR
jgi:DNA-binding transcriptional LysR family regulator